MNTLLSRITIKPEICHGKPCIRGMRWPVEVVIDMLGSGMSVEDILNDHQVINLSRCVSIGILSCPFDASKILVTRRGEKFFAPTWLRLKSSPRSSANHSAPLCG